MKAVLCIGLIISLIVFSHVSAGTNLRHQDVEPRYDEREPSLINKTLSTGENTQFPENETFSENSKLQMNLDQLQQDNKELHDTQNEAEHEQENHEGNKSNHPSRQDVEAGSDERETFLPRSKARRESKELIIQFTETGTQTETTRTNLRHQDFEPRCDEREPSLINKTLSTGENLRFPENETFNQTTCEKDQGSCLISGLIGAAVGIVVGFSIPTVISKILKWNKSNHPSRQDIKAGSDEQETIFPRGEARRESKQFTGQFTETATETETTNQNSKLKSDLKQLQQDNKQLCDTQSAVKHELETQKLQKDQLQSVNKLLDDTLNKVKTELENQKDQLLQKLRDVKTKRKENKDEVQMLENKITEKENSEDKELLLGEKEKMLKSQWKLDEEKKRYERQILNIEKAMEPIEMNMMRITEKNKDV